MGSPGAHFGSKLRSTKGLSLCGCLGVWWYVNNTCWALYSADIRLQHKCTTGVFCCVLTKQLHHSCCNIIMQRCGQPLHVIDRITRQD